MGKEEESGKAEILEKDVKKILLLKEVKDFKVSDFVNFIKFGNFFVGEVSSKIILLFDCETKKSPAIELSLYNLKEEVAEEKIFYHAKENGIYVEVTLAHIKEACERHMVFKEKIFKEDGLSNSFLIKDRFNRPWLVHIWKQDGSWHIYFRESTPKVKWEKGWQIFFLTTHKN